VGVMWLYRSDQALVTAVMPRPHHEQHEMGISPSYRGAGVLFGPDITTKFCEKNKFDLVVRSHECVPDGYECVELAPQRHVSYTCVLTSCVFRRMHWDKLVTVFSASHYTEERDNKAAILVLSHTLKQKFFQFEIDSCVRPALHSC